MPLHPQEFGAAKRRHNQRRLTPLIFCSLFSALCSLFVLPPPAFADSPNAWMQKALAGWFRKHRLPRLRPDPLLFRVARDNSMALAELVVSRKGQGTPRHGVSSYLRFLMVRHQVRDAVVQAVAYRFKDSAGFTRALVDFLGQRAVGGGLTHYGLGVAGTPQDRMATLVLVRRRVQVETVMARVGRPLRLCSRMLSGKRPRVVVTTPTGVILQRAPVLPGTHFCVRFPSTRKGIYQVEVMVDGPLGPEVAVLFPLYVGLPQPSMAVQKIYPPANKRRKRVETRLLRLVNASRSKAGLTLLLPYLRLARVARTHSADMRRSGFFGHVSPTRGDLATRLTSAGLDYAQASENLAISTGPVRAHDNLMRSPSHRRNIMDPKMTHVGIGVANDPQQGILHITECFARMK